MNKMNQLNNEEVRTSKENYLKQFGDDLDVHVDQNSQVKGTPKSFEEHVANYGKGQNCGLFDLQNMADMSGTSIEIVDETGKFPSNSPDGKTAAFHPKGKSSKSKNKKAMKMKFSTNPDGTNHVDLIDQNGTVIPVDGTQNQCFLEAVAKAQGVGVDQLIKNYKSYLLGSQRSR